MRRGLLFIPLFVLLLLTPVLAEQMQVGIYVLNLGKFDVSTGAFTADFYLSIKCDNPCEPDYEFMNGRATSVEKIIDEPAEKFYRIQANLVSPVDLKKFPFDSQKMQIILEGKERPIEGLQFVALTDESGIDDSIAFTGWDITGWTATVFDHYYPVYEETYSQYVFTVDISRIMFNAFLKTFLPVIFILLVVLFSFVLDPDKASTRLAMAGSSLVAAVMFHVSISNQIPPVGYLTFADKFMVLTYFVLLLTFVLNVGMMELQEQKRTELVEKLHRYTEKNVFIVVPLLYLLLFLFFV